MFRSPYELLFWIAALACLTGQAAVLRAALAGRAPGVAARPSTLLGEMGWVVVPLIVLLAVLYMAWQVVSASPLAVSPSGVLA